MKRQKHWNTLESLNEEQIEAVLETDTNLLIIAGAGSGKTRTLTHKIAYVIESNLASPFQIMALTFTNKAANEMKQRIEELVGSSVQDMYIGTFHSIALRILRNEGFRYTIYDTRDQEMLIKEILKQLNIDKKKYPPSLFLSKISSFKLNLIHPEEITPANMVEETVKKVYSRYEKALEDANAVDFDNIILKAIELLKNNISVREKYSNRFRYIFIDEYQDTNYPQYVFVKLLHNNNNIVCAVGDEDQSIYGFRGADITKILNFTRDFKNCRVVKLQKNYRSAQEILDIANNLISNNTFRNEKRLYSDITGGTVEVYQFNDEREEAIFVTQKTEELLRQGESPSQIAVLYRTNFQSRIVEEEMVKASIPYRIVGSKRFFERKEVKDTIAYLKLLINPDDNISFLRAIESHPRGIGKKLIETIKQFPESSYAKSAEALLKENRLNKRHRKALEEFMEIFSSININDKPADEVIDEVIEKSGYKNYLEQSKENGRIENIMELKSAAFDMSLNEFLESISLFDYSNEMEQTGGVNLMTIHAAKGLEFNSVFVIGVEEGLFPNAVLKESEREIEEERRLFYVAITRAKKRLFITHARNRRRGSQIVPSAPSRFIEELGIEDSSLQPSHLKRGDTIRHKIYGKGVILSVDTISDTEMLTVNFYKSGVKKVLSKDRNIELI